jgi:hypothetical protein
MSDRTFRLIFDGKKGGLVKGSSPSSAAKKGYKKLSAELGKTSIKFELQETTKDSKKKVYGPYKGCLEKDKIKVKMAGGRRKGHQVTANLNSYGNLPVYEEPYNSTPHGKKEFKILRKIPNQHEIKIEFDKLYNQQKSDFESVKQKAKLKLLLNKYQESNATNENKNELEKKYLEYRKLETPNQNLFRRFISSPYIWYTPPPT